MTWLRVNVHVSWWSVALFVAFTLYTINPELQHLGDAFSPSIPRQEWFLHLLQWGPDGCGTELCK